MDANSLDQVRVGSLRPANAIVASLLKSEAASSPPNSPPLPPHAVLGEAGPRSPSLSSQQFALRLARQSVFIRNTWFAETLRDRWASYLDRLDQCRQDPSAESVHELRVATRRLISQFILLENLLPSRKPEKARRILKRQLRWLGPLRDTHVQRMLIERQAARFPELVLLKEHIARRERDLVKAVSRRVYSIKKGKLERWVFELTADLTEQAADFRRRKRIIAAALRCAEDAFGQALECRQLIDFSDLRTVHRTRVAFKKFRYIVESLPPEATGWSKRELRHLAFYQRRMGTIQDLEVLDGCIKDFLERYQGNEDLLALFCAYLRRRQTRALGAFRKSVDRLCEFWPPPRVAGCLPSPSRQFPA